MKITKTSHPKLIKVAQTAFPNYKGRRFFLIYQASIDTGYNANWCEGSKTYYIFVRLDNGATLSTPDLAPWKRPGNEIVTLPKNCACVTHSFCSSSEAVTIYLSNSNLIKE